MDYDRDQLTEGFQYLDDLRESGRTNMFGAPQYMQAELVISKKEAVDVWGLWVKTFDGKTSVEDRVDGLMATA